MVWFCGIAAVLISVSAVLNVVELLREPTPSGDTVASDSAGRAAAPVAARQATALDLASDLTLIAIFLGCMALVVVRKPDRSGLVKLLLWLTGLVGTVIMLSQPLVNFLNLDAGEVARPRAELAMFLGFVSMVVVFIMHAAGALIIPLSWREATRTVLVLWCIFAATVVLLYPGPAGVKAGMIAVFPMVGLPGAVWSWLTYRRLGERFHARVLGERYSEMSSELSYARRIHESLLPAPVEDGPVRVRYVYEPMREIGGDFVYVHRAGGGDSALTAVIIDVSGHGVAAALAVNRLHGELIRFFATRPDAEPRELIESLNAFTSAWLAPQAVFATAAAARVDAAKGELLWCNAGHPPAFVLAAMGDMAEVRPLPATAAMLGVVDGSEYRAEQECVPMGVGATLVMYTDGASECRGRGGVLLGVERIEAEVRAGAAGGARSGGVSALERVVNAVRAHRRGPATDDLLVVEISR